MQKSKCFEEIPSYTQHLTFDAAERIFKRNGQNLDFQMKQTLKMTDSDGKYTNLGLLLSDQCKWLTMVAVFQGSEPDIMCCATDENFLARCFNNLMILMCIWSDIIQFKRHFKNYCA